MSKKFNEWMNFPITAEVDALPKVVCFINGAGAWSKLLDQIVATTGSAPARWPQKPWYDCNGVGNYPFPNEVLPMAEWANIYNQRQLRDSDSSDLLVSSTASERDLQMLTSIEESEEKFVSRLTEVCRKIEWVLFSLHEEWVCFVVSPERSRWIDQLKERCRANGVTTD